MIFTCHTRRFVAATCRGDVSQRFVASCVSAFTGCALKIRINFTQNWVLIFWKTQSFILTAKLHLLTKAVLLHLSSFWLLGCGNIAPSFSDSSVVSRSRLGQNTQLGTIFWKTNRFPLSNSFSSSNMFFIRLFLANTWKKFGSHHARLHVREKDNLFRHRA